MPCQCPLCASPFVARRAGDADVIDLAARRRADRSGRGCVGPGDDAAARGDAS